MRTQILAAALVSFFAFTSFTTGDVKIEKKQAIDESSELCFKYCENDRWIWRCPPLWEPVDMGPCPTP